jgi:hypothetical protein
VPCPSPGTKAIAALRINNLSKAEVRQTVSSSVEPCQLGQLEGSDLIPYERAAALIGIEPKRLLGRMMWNKVGDPIGGETPEGIMVYGWSLKTLAENLAADRKEAERLSATVHSDGAL